MTLQSYHVVYCDIVYNLYPMYYYYYYFSRERERESSGTLAHDPPGA